MDNQEKIERILFRIMAIFREEDVNFDEGFKIILSLFGTEFYNLKLFLKDADAKQEEIDEDLEEFWLSIFHNLQLIRIDSADAGSVKKYLKEDFVKKIEQ